MVFYVIFFTRYTMRNFFHRYSQCLRANIKFHSNHSSWFSFGDNRFFQRFAITQHVYRPMMLRSFCPTLINYTPHPYVLFCSCPKLESTSFELYRLNYASGKVFYSTQLERFIQFEVRTLNYLFICILNIQSHQFHFIELKRFCDGFDEKKSWANGRDPN